MTGAASRSPWLLRRRPRPSAAGRLYCFPHSGGSPGEYLRWADSIPDAEVWGLQLPGRGARLGESAPTTMAELVSAITAEVEFDDSAPFAFFGHSLGALVAYETARALQAAGRPCPRRVYLSAYGAPHLHHPGPPMHELDGPGLVSAVETEYGPLPPELHDDPELYRLVLQGLRGDLAILATYRHTHSAPLGCPITALGGSEDEETPARLAAWDRYTTSAFDLRMFPGDHFYFREHTDDVLAFLAATLA
ncbi:thioesterase [Rhodococcus opacus]|nr:thioesterase [Rhodococcus opacus]